jgi:hypothetical protein
MTALAAKSSSVGAIERYFASWPLTPASAMGPESRPKKPIIGRAKKEEERNLVGLSHLLRPSANP